MKFRVVFNRLSKTHHLVTIHLTVFFFLLTPLVSSQNANNFGFYGYLRSGFGIDGKGGPMDVFKAPNSEAKYRLGNEAEAYIEALFRYAYEDKNKTLFETNLRLAFVTPTSKSNEFFTTTSVREAYVRTRGIIKKKPDLAFWAGQRFYDRYDAHMIDFWYRDMSGFGGGIENVKIGKSVKLAFAFLGGSIDELQSNGDVQPEDEFSFNKITTDFSIYDIDIGLGTLGFTFDWSNFNGDSIQTDLGTFLVNSSNGWSIGMFHEVQFKGGRNRLIIFYGTGAAENYKAVMQQPIGITPKPGIPIEVKEFKRFRILNDLQIDISSKFSLLGLLLYQRLDNNQIPNNILNWFSAGIRPSYHIGQYFSLVGEFGLDYTSQLGFDNGTLFKMTIAPQISPLNKILSRPAIRAYLTYAKWSDTYIGQIATSSFPNQNNGISFGIQMETWW